MEETRKTKSASCYNVHNKECGMDSQNVAIHSGKIIISDCLKALRPWSFTASLIPVAIGSCIAYKTQGVFNVNIFLTTVVTVVCVHAAGNLVNTYHDFMNGVDNKTSDDRTLVDNILVPASLNTMIVVFYVAASFGFMMLILLSPAKLEFLVFIYFCGIFSSYFYTGGLGIKYIALGDILIVLTFGPVVVMFSYLSQTGELALAPIVYAIPQALNIEAILHSNNTRDIDSDRRAGCLTIAILLGTTGSYLLFVFLLFAPYMMFLTISVYFCLWLLLPASSIFLAVSLEKQFRMGNLKLMPQKVAELNMLMGILYVISIYVAQPASLPYL